MAAKKTAKKKATKKKAAKKKTPAKKKAPASRARSRPKGRPKWADKFIEEIRKCGNAGVAARRAGIGRRTAYHLRNDDEGFLQEWEDALCDADDDLEVSVFEKAKDGWLEPVFYKGVRVGVKNRFSPELAWKMLQRRMPERYNLPTHDPLQSQPGEAGSPAAASVFFYPDADEARRLAEQMDEEAKAQ